VNKLPILNIDQFQNNKGEEELYANILSDHLIVHDATISAPHKHDFYLTVLFTQGSGVHEVDFNSYPIKKGALFLINPGQTHYWNFFEKVEGYIFFHSKEYYDFHFPNKSINKYPFYYSVFNPSVLFLDHNQVLNYILVFKDIIKEKDSWDTMAVQKIALLIDLLYINTTRIYLENEGFESVTNEKRVVTFNKLEGLVESNYLIEKKPEYYAVQLNVSIKHLNKIVKNTIGKTTSEFIQERIILEAKRMLANGKYTSQDVAFELGFDDPSYFSRFFKKKCNVSPIEFANIYE
jgi:AraC family transcriptional activator of pobA